VPSLIFGSGFRISHDCFMPGYGEHSSGTVQSMAFSLSQHQYIGAAHFGINAASLNLKDALNSGIGCSTAYIELETVNSELDAARQQEPLRVGCGDRAAAHRCRRRFVERTVAGQLTVAQLKLKRLHLETRRYAQQTGLRYLLVCRPARSLPIPPVFLRTPMKATMLHEPHPPSIRAVYCELQA